MSGTEIQAFILASTSALFNGSFAACAKLTSLPIDPILFTFYNSIGVFLSSFLVIPILPFLSELPDTSIYKAGSSEWHFTYLGLIAGSLYIFAAVLSFAAVRYIGLGIGQGVWGGAAILVSFLWGVLALGDSVDSIGVAVLSLVVLMLGIAGIALNDIVASKLFGVEVTTFEKLPLAESKNEKKADNGASKSNFVLGVSCALGVGIFGGSILVPMSFVSATDSGLAFAPSLGIGALISSTLFIIVYYGMIYKLNPFETFTWNGFLLGVLSGVIWNAGNICSIFAIAGIGYATAYPIFQCALFFGGLWGIFLFKEVTDKKEILVFFLSAVVLFAGAVLLSINTNS